MAQKIDLSFLASRDAMRRIGAITLVAGLIGIGTALLLPKWFRSTLTVAPAKTQRPSIGGLLGGDLSGIAAGFDSALGGSADVARVAAVLQSVSVSDAIIEKFDLRTRYDEGYQELARERLWSHCEVRTLPKPSLVQLSCEDRDPRFVQEMLTFFASYGNEVFRRVNAGSASEEVRFLEKRVADLRQDAEATAGRMRAFQEKNHIVDLDAQARAVVTSMATLNNQRIGRRLELNLGRRYSAPDEPSIRQLESQLRVVEQELGELQEPAAAGEPPPGVNPATQRSAKGLFPAALAVPQLRAEFEALYRDRRVSEAALLFALERLEGARANEARDTSTFQILDPPALPTRHTRPKRLMVVLGLVLLGLAAGVALEWWRAHGGLRWPPTTRAATRP